MQEDFITEFFQDFSKEIQDLEKFIAEDNILKIDTIVWRMQKMLRSFKQDLDKAFKKAIRGF